MEQIWGFNRLQISFVSDDNLAQEEILSGDGLKMDPSLLNCSIARYDIILWLQFALLA